MSLKDVRSIQGIACRCGVVPRLSSKVGTRDSQDQLANSIIGSAERPADRKLS